MTVGSPILFGQQAISDRMPHAEQVIDLGGYGNQVGYQGSLTFGIGTVVMPWLGMVTAHVVHQGNYGAGVMGVSLWLNGSSPAPNAFFAGSLEKFQDVGTSYESVAAMAQWHDLAKGSTLTVNARVECFVGNVNWVCNAFVGWIRLERL